MGVNISKSTVATVTFSTPQEIVINKADDSIASWQGGTWNIADVTGTVSLPTGAATETTLNTVSTRVGSLTETAPGTDTASSGLNGRLQRIAQRLTSLIAQIPAALGQTTKSGSLSVTVASDQTLDVSFIPNGDSNHSPSNASTTAYAGSLVIKNSAGVMLGLIGYNSGPDQFIQLHNATSLPANGSVPVIVLKVTKTSNFFIAGVDGFGRYFSTGIVVTNSTTGPTLTAGANDCWFDAQYK